MWCTHTDMFVWYVLTIDIVLVGRHCHSGYNGGVTLHTTDGIYV